MNDPNAVPLDRIPVSTPSIPRFGGLPELPELPGEFAPLPPYRTPTSVTTVPFPSSPPKVVVEPPKAPPKVTVELPKPIVKTSPPPTVASTAPQPRWVREAIQDVLTPNRKKGLALTVAAGLIVGAIALNAGFSGIGSPTRPSNSLVAATTPEKQTTPKLEEPKQEEQKTEEQKTEEQKTEEQKTEEQKTEEQKTEEQKPKTELIVPQKALGMNVPIVAIPALVAPSSVVAEAGGAPEQFVPIAVTQPVIKQVTYTEPPVAPVTMPPPVNIPSPPGTGSTPPYPVLPEMKLPAPLPTTPTPTMPVIDDVKPVAPSIPVTPATNAPVTPDPVKIADVAPPVVPKPTPVVTTPVVAAPATLMTPNGQPNAFQEVPPMPVAVTPTAPVPLPPAPSVSGLANIYPAPQTLGAQSTPPAAIRPVTSTEVRTAIDVDLHEPKRGDTYASISKMHYGDDRYATAIQAFNKGRNLGDGAAIELPLTQYLRQNYRQYIGGTQPVSNDPARTPEWAPSAGRAVPTPRTFTVNREGMTMWDVAEDVYGDRQKWKQIQDANPQLDANERYRIGDRFRLPLDAPQTVKRVP